MTEGHVYRCDWRENDDGTFQVWWIKHPNDFATGPTIDDACDDLLGIICMLTGDGEAVLDWVRPTPDDEAFAEFLTPRIVAVSGNSHTGGGIPIGRFDHFFAGGFCEECGRGLGPRTDEPLVLRDVEPDFEGGFTSHPIGTLHYFSERFISLLSDEERARCHFRPVKILKARRRKRYLELVAGPEPIEWVVPNIGEVEGCRCSTCGRISASPSRCPIWHFIPRAKLPANPDLPFVLGSSFDAHLCMSAKRWNELADQPEARGLLSTPVGLVEDRHLTTKPDVPPYDPDLQWVDQMIRGEAKSDPQAMIELCSQRLIQHQAVEGDSGPQVLAWRFRLIDLLQRQERYDEALPLCCEQMEAATKTLGADSPEARMARGRMEEIRVLRDRRNPEDIPNIFD